MEKSRAHYSLIEAKRLVAAHGIEEFTQTAQEGAARMGLTPEEAVESVLSLTHRDFYKSMTTHARHDVWQDVYHTETVFGAAYVKITLFPNARVVIQFKEKQND
jgi:motility quorum-sensing regulator/GCU-specific mRNA interferase toxin